MVIVEGSFPERGSRLVHIAVHTALVVLLWAFVVLVVVDGSWAVFLWGAALVAVLGWP